jgi:REP element-mobilizing transposase RayT
MSLKERSTGVPPVLANANGHEARSPFFNPDAEITTHQRELPHWQQGEVYYFVTWRLADSLPQAILQQWQEEKRLWLLNHPSPLSEGDTTEFHRQFSSRMDAWLDDGSGSCVLKQGAVREVVQQTLRYFDAQRYELNAFVIMPNHVHVLFRLMPAQRIEWVIHSWKSFSAKAINQLLNRSGSLWQEEYWDRMIRHEPHLNACAGYIRDNPAKAKLAQAEYTHFERSTGVPPVF